MSLVYLTHHNENIYDIEKKIKTEPFKKTTPPTKFCRKVRYADEMKKPNIIELPDGKKLLTDSKLYKNKTMGYAETPLESPPFNFLRKNQGIRWQRERAHNCPKLECRPELPLFAGITAGANKPCEMIISKGPYMDHYKHNKIINSNNNNNSSNNKNSIDFIKKNIERNKTAQTRPPIRYVDTATGTRHNLLNTGLIPQFICQKKYGKVPNYLQHHKKMLQEMRLLCCKEENERQKLERPGVRQMSTAERFEILTGLKTNFAEQLKAYQSISLFIDTIAKRIRKEKLEQSLRQLEQDIHLLDSNRTILISDY